jgi:hypothetical protein
MVGEFRASRRTNLTGDDYSLNYASTTYWNRYVVNAAQSHGMYPIAWDIPGQLFDWNTGAILDQSTVNAFLGKDALPPPNGDGAQYCFELSSQSWSSTGAPIAGVATSTAQKFAGAQSLAVNFNGGAATSSISTAAPSVPAGKTITFHVWIPSGSKISSIQPYVQDHNGRTIGKRHPIDKLKADAWNTLTVPLPSTAATPVRQIGVRFTTSAAWTGTCYIDSVGW